MINPSPFEKKIGITFSNKNLLLEALTHRSYCNEHPEWKLGHNERLEFLGDAVLEIVVTEHLFRSFPNPEGDLTAWRASLVNSNMLSRIAAELSINDYVLLSKGETKDIGRARQVILANALEAIIGAIYLDQGIDAASRFIASFVFPQLLPIIEGKLFQDAKSVFQEIAQEKVGVTPRYEVLAEWGPDHDKHFRVGLYLSDELVAEGEGSSKQEAQRNAAQNGLQIKNWD
ncbi:MAG: ribonuclease III [Candidatus Terrybacteria bacterium RIFCSPLOWO2_01_FULL_44_24]|uniref:Ribonuclease 3 n=1 Tax=Candidatus Terrybacteria bacterium RIFCSPHIGHO2_01_FULL_43_35 TaxID=1802361 RepID=A0A1G2PDX1_9BACT|nr:MAG: ribonuclease III [Candidatus Terrybacteria bacterium RIFCSPHIGHO2_01_FULL_43_35]OHA49615.1 MAG: ribonuclease III [Candidatus Terrybacteria bacterium RIFCSPHIGHO2_02_FULL_43_14]OHA51501.1 MAG: ribonuclease III [Candidatus Terrybacteria bacterium RIFCSPLOWO2_01_FULL_44_24]